MEDEDDVAQLAAGGSSIKNALDDIGYIPPVHKLTGPGIHQQSDIRHAHRPGANLPKQEVVSAATNVFPVDCPRVLSNAQMASLIWENQFHPFSPGAIFVRARVSRVTMPTSVMMSWFSSYASMSMETNLTDSSILLNTGMLSSRLSGVRELVNCPS